MTGSRLDPKANETSGPPLRPVGVLQGGLKEWAGLEWRSFESSVGPAQRAQLVLSETVALVAERFHEGGDDVMVYGSAASDLDMLLREWGLDDGAVLDRFSGHPPARSSDDADQARSAVASLTQQMLGMMERIAAVQSEIAQAAESRVVALQAALNEPPGTRRRVLELSGDGLTLAQVAEVLELKPQTVQRHYRAGLRAFMDSHLGVEVESSRMPAEQVAFLSREARSLHHDIADARGAWARGAPDDSAFPVTFDVRDRRSDPEPRQLRTPQGDSSGGTALKVKQVKSRVGSDAAQLDTLKSLGLRRIGHTVEVKDSPQTRGMLHRVRHLIQVNDD